MFLDRIDLSKTVERRGTERCHVLSRSSRFLAAVLVERGPILTKKRLKTVKIGLDREERSFKSEYSNSTSFSVTTFFSMFSHRFSLFLACLQSFKGLSTLIQGSFKIVQGYFCTFPSKFVY